MKVFNDSTKKLVICLEICLADLQWLQGTIGAIIEVQNTICIIYVKLNFLPFCAVHCVLKNQNVGLVGKQ